MDLRAVGLTPGAGSVSGEGKLITLTGDAPAVITLQFWAQATSADPGNGIFGVNSLVGSIKTAAGPGGPAVFGSMGVASLSPAFQLLYRGPQDDALVQELSDIPDGSLDLGSNGPSPATGYINAFKDVFGGGTEVDRFHFVSNLDPVGTPFAAIPGGYEFLIGSATFTVATLGDAAGSTLINWAIPDFGATGLQKSYRAARGYWTDGDGITNTGFAQADELHTGAPVTIVQGASAGSIPEPGSASLLLGGLSLLGTRRRKNRAM